MTDNLNNKLDLLVVTFKELFAQLPSIASDKEYITATLDYTNKNIEELNSKIDQISAQREALKKERNEVLGEILELDTKKTEMARIDAGITERLKMLSNLTEREAAISGLEKDIETRNLDIDAKEKNLVERENQLKTEIDLDRLRKDTLLQKEKALADKEARLSKVVANYTS